MRYKYYWYPIITTVIRNCTMHSFRKCGPVHPSRTAPFGIHLGIPLRQGTESFKCPWRPLGSWTGSQTLGAWWDTLVGLVVQTVSQPINHLQIWFLKWASKIMSFGPFKLLLLVVCLHRKSENSWMIAQFWPPKWVALKIRSTGIPRRMASLPVIWQFAVKHRLFFSEVNQSISKWP